MTTIVLLFLTPLIKVWMHKAVGLWRGEQIEFGPCIYPCQGRNLFPCSWYCFSERQVGGSGSVPVRSPGLRDLIYLCRPSVLLTLQRGDMSWPVFSSKEDEMWGAESSLVEVTPIWPQTCSEKQNYLSQAQPRPAKLPGNCRSLRMNAMAAAAILWMFVTQH